MEIPEAAEKKEKSFLTRIAGWPGMIGAYVLGRIFGWTFLWPMFGSILSGILAVRFLKPRHLPLAPALALQGGQLSWLLVALFFLFGGFGSPANIPAGGYESYPYGQILDVVIQITLILWVAFRPTFPAIITASLYNVIGLANHVFSLTASSVSVADEKGLAIHMLLNVGIIVLLFFGLFKVRSEARASANVRL
ncbi:MAG: hypothetical protein Q7S58_12815 [Candidatus Binatus sp.]|uniref:hypothetical protein n=1 Tax=Candidatus Binatus sp. TaxID=2811406 RepID=UPI0027181CC4|nr:hypothetical protein [Candidatus Binatus sp.]MDO8433281.1 hypothetical protein [Candidatus Binatus sp.]